MCVKKCLVGVFYILINYVKDKLNKDCLKYCKDLDYLLNFFCIGKCLKGFFSYKR